jgi:trigger factor
MQIEQTAAEGLSRTLTVTVAKSDLASRLDARIKDMQPKVRLKGFRPGKVPASHIRRMFAGEMMGELVQELVREGADKALSGKDLRPASQPEIDLRTSMEEIQAGKADLAFDVKVDIMPEFEPTDPKDLAFTKPVAEVSDEEITKQLEEIAKQQEVFASRKKGSKSKDGDQLVIDFAGRRDGVAFDGGTAEDMEIVLGAGRFIPGFEEALVGLKAGDEKTFPITFPTEYPAKDLAGAEAEFTVTVKDVRAPKEAKVDEDLAKAVGFEDLEKLKEAVKTNIAREFDAQSRQRAKRRILDALDEKHAFDLPQRMVEAEFGQIWQQVLADKEAGELDDDDQKKSDAELEADYRKIAERRVRLGLVLAEMGRKAGVEVTEAEVARAINQEAMRYRGQEQQVVRFFQENPGARAQIRAPLYEEKVIDLILETATVSQEKVSREDLFKDD